MKMVIAVINHDDASMVIHNLTKSGFYVTRLATTGGFLKAGNVTILVGVEDNLVQNVINIIKEFSKTRETILPNTSTVGSGFYPCVPVKVIVGGATIFVVDVDRFEKV